MSGRGTWLPRALLSSAVLVLGAACGQVSDATLPTTASGGASGVLGAAGSSGTAGFLALAGTAGAADPRAVALSTSDCAARRVSDCQGVRSLYMSNSKVFDEAPDLAPCTPFNSWDGCSTIQFGFDAQGCANTVVWHAPGASEALPELRQCLDAALQNARFPCLALGTLRYEESCYIH